jgi:hypothetical protein
LIFESGFDETAKPSATSSFLTGVLILIFNFGGV